MKMSQSSFLTFLTLALLVAVVAVANPLSEEQKAKLNTQSHATQKNLRGQMNQMIVSIADLDILTNRDQIADYELFVQDADRILQAIGEVRKIDTSGVFKSLLDELEKPTQKLKDYSLKKDKRAMDVPDEIFNVCFKCHATHRDS